MQHLDHTPTLEQFFAAATAGGETGLKIIEKFIAVNKQRMPEIINTLNPDGDTVSICAARNGHADIVAVLVKVPGNNINFGICKNIEELKNLVCENYYQTYALMWAVIYRHPEVVRILAPIPVSAINAVVIVVDEYGYYSESTVLIEAVVSKKVQSFLILLSVATIQINLLVERCKETEEKEKISALILAARWGYKDIFSALFARADINLERDAIPALKEAVKGNHFDIACTLIAKITDVVELKKVRDSYELQPIKQRQHSSHFAFSLDERIELLEDVAISAARKANRTSQITNYQLRMDLFRMKIDASHDSKLSNYKSATVELKKLPRCNH